MFMKETGNPLITFLGSYKALLNKLFVGYQACSLSDDWPISSRTRSRNFQLDREGTPLQAKDWDGVARGGKHHLSWYIKV